MRTAHITIDEKLHEWADNEATEFFGSEKKFSTYVSMLIKKDQRAKKQNEINERIKNAR
jgi:hypothetical protein